ncbi:MAG TPA: hypothetical protein PKD09_17775 [Aggregatilinea sp.]|uniref:hypothetical protein n=1 Tax=Aggregatilinea sp. TaxID=2806333 RepID=UPI002C978FFA|nr:hypothetical protein [Aggregatilinea sp.]HML23510.1 hypothetical protein [Aggregatilinea sp.]
MTALITEGLEYLGGIAPASHSTEQNTGSINCGLYERVLVVLHCGVIGGNLDVDIEQQASSGGTPKALDSNSKDVAKTATTDNDTVTAININAEEFDVNNGYEYLNVEVTPASAGIFGVQVWGVPRYKPAANALLDAVVE